VEKQVFETRGNMEIFSQKKLALFASRQAPQQVWSAVEAVFKTLLELPLSLAGGWQAPLERHLLNLPQVGAGKANFIFYLARNLNEYESGGNIRRLLEADKLLFIAPETTQKRPSRRLIDRRDKLLFSQINRILFLYIHPGGRLEAYFNLLLQKKYHLYVLDHPANAAFQTEGVVGLNTDNVRQFIQEL